MFLLVPCVGAPSIALHRDDPTRQYFLRRMEKICKRHIPANKLSRLLDLQFIVLLEADTSGIGFGLLSDRQEHTYKWFASLASLARSTEPDTPDATDEYLNGVLVQAFRRMMPYNFDKHLALTDFDSRSKPFELMPDLEVLVVS